MQQVDAPKVPMRTSSFKAVGRRLSVRLKKKFNQNEPNLNEESLANLNITSNKNSELSKKPMFESFFSRKSTKVHLNFQTRRSSSLNFNIMHQAKDFANLENSNKNLAKIGNKSKKIFSLLSTGFNSTFNYSFQSSEKLNDKQDKLDVDKYLFEEEIRSSLGDFF